MNPSIFPKPKPATPPPLDEWLDLADRAEVGREPFFHGRDSEYEIFQRAVNSLNSGHIGGGTIIVQGAPGAGKSALMLECMEAVRRHSSPDDAWVAVQIRPEALASPIDTVATLIDAVNAESSRLAEIAPKTKAEKINKMAALGSSLHEELARRGFGIAGFSLGARPKIDSQLASSASAGRLFGAAASLLKECRIVVFVDEAQNTPVEKTTRGVMDCLHNPPCKIPLVALFFGLSNTLGVLHQCGISRFADERVITLKRLSKLHAVGALRCMLDTYYEGAGEDKAAWASALGELSQGWPQHISRVGVAAGRMLRLNNSHLQSHLLEQVLAKGAERKKDYYAGRLAVGSQDPALYRQIALAAFERPNGILSRKQLRLLVSPALEDSQESFDDFMANALYAGLLAPMTDLPYHYQFPIPSFCDYLRDLPV